MSYYKYIPKYIVMQENGKTVLVPLDFSEYSFKAAELAFDIANYCDGVVLFIHANFVPIADYTYTELASSSFDYPDEEFVTNMHMQIDRQMEQFISAIKNNILSGQLPDVKFDYKVIDGIPEEVINRLAKRTEAYCIVMGTRGNSQKESDLLGSVTAEVIDTSLCPVFAVPEDSHVCTLKSVNKISFITNFDPRDADCFQTMLSIDGFAGKTISMTILYDDDTKSIYAKEEDAERLFSDKFPQISIEYTKMSQEDLLENTNTFIKDNGIDLLVLPTHKRNIFSRLFSPAVAHKMVFHSNTTLLAIQSKK